MDLDKRRQLDPELTLRTPSPFLLSIEPVGGKAYTHGYHLGTDEKIAREFAQELWTRVNNGIGCTTVALIRERRIYDVWDGVQWVSEIHAGPFYEYDNG
jgi:hypothetical protein